jgi:hypothetical protein
MLTTPPTTYRCLSNQPAIAIDRALRKIAGPSDLTEWRDPNSGLVVSRPDTGGAPTGLERMPDVWRVLSAQFTDAWPRGNKGPHAVNIDVRVVTACLYALPLHGRYRPENAHRVTTALHFLSSVCVTAPMGTTVTPVDEKGKMQRRQLPSSRSWPLIDLVPCQGELVDAPWTYTVSAGPWVTNYPRQFALIDASLLRRPASHVRHQWIKSIGMELAFHAREDRVRDDDKVLRVGRLLARITYLDDVKSAVASRNWHRMRRMLETALTVLVEDGLVVSWRYHPEDEAQIARSRLRDLDSWLDMRLQVRLPTGTAKRPTSTSRDRRPSRPRRTR